MESYCFERLLAIATSTVECQQCKAGRAQTGTKHTQTAGLCVFIAADNKRLLTE